MAVTARMKIRRLLSLLVVGAATLGLGGCSFLNADVINPAGPVAATERNLLFTALLLMLLVAVPVFVMTFWFARTYRASNQDAHYRPEWDGDRKIEMLIWGVPALIVLILGVLVWYHTNRLDPYRPLSTATGKAPLVVEAVALDWKWLFLYPQQGIATLNDMVIPTGRPIQIKLTADTVMNSFYVPALSGQIYAMAGMETQLNLMADKAGIFSGRNAQYSGRGFASQHFTVKSVPEETFNQWVGTVRHGNLKLDQAAYQRLAENRSPHQPAYYSTFYNGLFKSVIDKYASAPHRGHGLAAAQGAPRNVR